MPEILDRHVLKNKMVILGEPMPQVGSVAFTFLLPSGSAFLPEGCCGAGAVITDWLFRGAGNKNSRELIDALDSLGLHRSSAVSTKCISLGAALEASNLDSALDLYADIILQPALDCEQFELSRQLAVHDLVSLDDDPRQKVMLEVYENFYPSPFGLPAIGKLDDLSALTPERTASIVKERFNLSETIFAIAGKYDFDAVVAQLEKLFEIEQPGLDLQITTTRTGQGYCHNQHDGAQVHIGLMTAVPPATAPGYYNAMAAASILGGGMSSRLFTEVREKRGLCYAIGARYHTLKDYAGITSYAGTTPDKAQQTIDVIRGEFDRLSKGITPDEMQIAKVGLKASLIMQSESSSIRAVGIASDYHLLGRVRTLQEIKDKLEQLSTDSVKSFLDKNKFNDYTVVTIGPQAIEVKS
jgi:predicted Zn-dependent peptidase